MIQTKYIIDKNSKTIKNKKYDNKILGPVPSLEDYVSADWWQHLFNSLYLKTDADVVEDTKLTYREVDKFSGLLQLKPEDIILDLCCGQGRHAIELAKRGLKVEGFDRSHYLIQRARSIAKKENLSVRFKEGDARKLIYPADSFSVVMMLGNSFGYFETVQDDRRILKEIFRVLMPWGRLLLDVADGEFLRENFQARSWEWIDKKLFVCRERSLSADRQRLISREIITDVAKGVIADQFYAERLYSKDDLFRAIEEAGFVDIAINGEIITDSSRNQDLGMMERRIIVTCQVQKDWTPVKGKSKKADKKKIVVLFGDPAKPDPLKPSAVFDDDDFYTIDQLKSVLRTLDDYDISYLSNHNTLIQVPIAVQDPILSALLAGIISGTGSGIILRSIGSAGGSDILSVILLNRFSVRIGSTTLAFNSSVLIAAAIFSSLESALYTLICLYVSSHILNLVVTGLSQRKAVFIVSPRWEEISREILQKIGRGVTIIQGQGGYSRQEEQILYTIITFRELSRLKRIIRRIDPNAFLVVSDTLEVVGRRIGNQPRWQDD